MTAPIRSHAMRKLDELDKRLGKGPTFSNADRKLVLSGIPAWLVLGRQLASGELSDRCGRTITALVDLQRALAPLLPDGLWEKSDG